MNITKAFADFMASQGYGVLGTDIFVGGVPQSAPDKAWWLTAGGGSATIKSVTGEKMKNYLVNAYYRNTDEEDVLNTLQAFEEFINAGNCNALADYNNIELEATSFPIDQDLDSEDRSIGTLQITITVYTN